MLAQCEGMEGPPNVGCYKELAFEEAFTACDYTYAASKKSAYYKYFWDEHITAEQERACVEREGEYNKESHKCLVSLSYKRYAEQGKSMLGMKVSGTGCDDKPPNTTRRYELGGKPVPCTHENFGLGECRTVDQGIQQQKDLAMMAGIVSLGTAAIGGVVSGIAAHQTRAAADKARDTPSTFQTSANNAERRYNECTSVPQGASGDLCDGLQSDYIMAQGNLLKSGEFNKKEETPSVPGAVWEAASGGVVEGATKLGTAMIYDSVGGQVPGKCIMSDGSEYMEGRYIQMNW
jgi:hypothetical protein